MISFVFHPMMTSSNGNIFRVTGPLCGEFTVPGEFPTPRPVTRSFDVFFDLRLNKWLSKQPWGWWFEMPSWSLWRQCYVYHICGFMGHTPKLSWERNWKYKFASRLVQVHQFIVQSVSRFNKHHCLRPAIVGSISNLLFGKSLFKNKIYLASECNLNSIVTVVTPGHFAIAWVGTLVPGWYVCETYSRYLVMVSRSVLTGRCDLWVSCQMHKIAGCSCAGNAGTFSLPPQVSDPDMHQCTYVTHVPWCMPGSLTSGFLWSQWHSRRVRNPQFYVSDKIRPRLQHSFLFKISQMSWQPRRSFAPCLLALICW